METITQYQTVEIVSDSPLTIKFPSWRDVTVFPFQKMDGRWYVRFSSPEIGIIRLSNNLRYRVVSYRGRNRLFTHGPVHKRYRQLVHHDGTFFFYLADTWWFGMTKRAPLEDLLLLLADRKKKGFTAIQTVIGVPPEVPFFSPQAETEGGHPFTREYQINPAYFDAVDRRIQKILDYGFVPCIFGGWGDHIDVIGVMGAIRLWREILARYSSYPVMFCLTGEVDIIRPVLSRWQRFFLLHKRLKQWEEVGRWVKRHDPYHRILMVHPHARLRAFELFEYPYWLDVDSIQSGHSEESKEFMISALKNAKKEDIPIINLEPWYEGIFGNFWEDFQKEACKISLKYGACGHAYGAHGVWQMARDDNFMGHWGDSDWRDAYKYPGSGLLGKLVQNLYNTH
ncbi:MAG: DUF4038 domain-containing protein [Patescibacteria group bacterium]|nr:DUF4038 domain-containing protein [Patescibacteria group bacterium]